MLRQRVSLVGTGTETQPVSGRQNHVLTEMVVHIAVITVLLSARLLEL